MYRQRYTALLLVAWTSLFVTQTYGFTLRPFKWPSPATTFHVDNTLSFANANAPNANVNDDAFEQAMEKWNTATVFKFSIVRDSFVDPCRSPNENPPANGIIFAGEFCLGVPWTTGVLALDRTWSNDAITIQSGIVFNSDETWDVYDDAHSTGSFAGTKDFRRIAVHELGHTIGLLHEVDPNLATIMDKFLIPGSVELAPQSDDINGVNVLYNIAATVLLIINSIMGEE